MTKEGSRRSSVGGAPSPSIAHDPTPSNEVADRVDDTKKPAEAEVSVMRTVESQPMTASNSTSSNPSSKDVGGATAYGTRSRNRNGNSRPNYAEDKELDVDFEMTPSTKESHGRKSARTGETAPILDSVRATSSTRKIAAPDIDQSNVIQNNYKEQIPGTSTFSANPNVSTNTTQPSKKRKAGGQLPAAGTSQFQQQQQSHQSIPVGQVITRRASMAAHVAGVRDSNMLTFDECGGHLMNKTLAADDGTILEVNDHVYLVCEPPGEPYYLGRIMEFLHLNNDSSEPIDALRLNWYYRPKDIGRKVNDTRQVFASMHSDISPLTSLRGKCEIKHKSEVERLDDLRKTKDCFWYEKLYDRYIHRFYEVIPTGQIINVPVEVKKVLDERWRYIVAESTRAKELTSAVKSCKRCNKYCASNDSVDCAVCRNTYHMSCVNPPLLKKPSRGFAWACGPCSKAQEKKLEARNTPNINDTAVDGDDDELNDDDDELTGALEDGPNTGQTSPARSSEAGLSIHPGTTEQIHQAGMWLFRYLGIHCKVEDALDYDDRIYPRASSRLGPRHQANVLTWPGRPVEYVKPAEIKKKYMKGHNNKKDAKLSKETVVALEADKTAREQRPKWVVDEPPGYIHRGEDYDNDDPNNTARLLFRIPEVGELPTGPQRGSGSDSEQFEFLTREQIIGNYMIRAHGLAKSLGLPELSTNLLDVALETLQQNSYDVEKALQVLAMKDKKAFKEPELSTTELKKFEDGVTKHGSEWHSIKKHVKTVSTANIVRFYYTWKKTDRGKQIWGNYTGRKGKKEAKRAEASAGKLQDDVADEYDDSAFDNDKAAEKKRGFQCKFCATRSSRQWRRAPSTPAGTTVMENPNAKTSGKDKGTQLMVALCRRCAELWRRYAIQWEDVDEVAKKVAQAGGRAWKRKIDEELLKELVAANEVMNQTTNATPLAPISAGGTPVPTMNVPAASEPPRKKVKGAPERESTDASLDSGAVLPTASQKKKIVVEKPKEPPPPPEPPKARLLPCAVCDEMDPLGDQHISLGDNRSPSKWVCDMCSNDKNPQVSIQYKCMLCPVEYTEQDFVEPPRVSHKKKSEKERERDRVERENALKVADYFRKKQEEMNKPVNPREPLKRTANNNWVHVTCAVFTPEVKFGNGKAMEPSEGIPSIASARYDEILHVECAHQNGYVLGFDIAPVKGSRRDQFNIVNINGEIGVMTAAVWCKEHMPTKTIVHRMHDIVDETGLNALQLYVQNFKQADLTLTGTVRKATLMSTKVVNPLLTNLSINRRASTITTANNNSTSGRGSISNIKVEQGPREAISPISSEPEKVCVTCGIDVSPRWWPHPPSTNGLAVDISTRSNGNSSQSDEPTLTNGENGGGHIALAAAALHQNTRTPAPVSTELQCHQCHWKKLRKEPSPPPALVVPQPEVSRLPIPPPPQVGELPADQEVPRSVVPQYTWPPPPLPPTYPPNQPYSNWSHPSPIPQNVAVGGQLNGNHSPQVTPRPPQQLNGQPHMRQAGPGIPQSPHQNGHRPNGYPPSPRRGMGSTPIHMPNGTYPSYAATRPAPQHLTNGGPPPRAPEHPFPQNNSSVHHQPYGGPHAGPHGSPSIPREPQPQPRDLNNAQNNGTRPNDTRVNGGASASPSLRNLLS
ncbi:hypothetical protein B7494_g1901 [Chlorociboria aeruginascens]|nr:hypothetical protein B7494_g1901 [Chlorociboria aeruginascens]